MSLTTGMDVGVSGLAVAGQRTAVVSRHISRSGDLTASRRTVNTITRASDEPARPRALVPGLQLITTIDNMLGALMVVAGR
jgi:hypothetical protein